MSRKRALSPGADEKNKLLDADITDEDLKRLEDISKEVARIDLINGAYPSFIAFTLQRTSLTINVSSRRFIVYVPESS